MIVGGSVFLTFSGLKKWPPFGWSCRSYHPTLRIRFYTSKAFYRHFEDQNTPANYRFKPETIGGSNDPWGNWYLPSKNFCHWKNMFHPGDWSPWANLIHRLWEIHQQPLISGLTHPKEGHLNHRIARMCFFLCFIQRAKHIWFPKNKKSRQNRSPIRENFRHLPGHYNSHLDRLQRHSRGKRAHSPR